jgi:S-DNA-T family DNA segregation ATPase FtsK/SpoIIIE
MFCTIQCKKIVNDGVKKMIVTLIIKEHIRLLTLPEKISGQFWISDLDESGISSNLISVEGVSGNWILKSSKSVKIFDFQNTVVKNPILKPLCFYKLLINSNCLDAFIYTEPNTDDRQIYKKLIAISDTEITIGRAENNDIVFLSRIVSSNHAKLVYHGGTWTITDTQSTNGTYVNGQKVTNRKLKPGDTIFIMGFKVIIGTDFIAFNNPDDQVKIRTDNLLPFALQKIDCPDGAEDECEPSPIEYFYRSPRFKRDIEKAVFKIDSPPQSGVGEEIPVMLTVGPAMTMGMASLATGAFAVNNAISTGNIKNAIPSIVMSSSMLLGTVLWPILSKRFDKKNKTKKEKLRQEKYKEYMDSISGKFADECKKQEEILRENFVQISECENRIRKVQRNLWERGPGQNDFLKLRLGIGNANLLADISYSERRFSINSDNLQEALYTLCETPKPLTNIPIHLSLFDNYISGIIGERKITKAFAQGLILQLAALYSYDEIKLVFIFDIEEMPDFGFVKWLPHVWNNDGNFRLLATTNNEVKEVSAYIEKEIENRNEVSDNDMPDVLPYYVIFAMSRTLAVRAEMLKQIYSKKKNIQISVVTFYDELKNLPKDCTTVVELDEGAGKIFDRNDISGQFTSFVPDILPDTDLEELSIRLANVPLDTLANSFRLPSMVTFLEMFGVGKVEHLNALTRWQENDPTQSLEAAVGIDTLGELFKLDLHEKFHGPHGLVAGMTGSGKSEFIITYILSLAVNYHPNEVAFILIDYKGGGMAKAFENLPHTAGIITNLDGAAVKRSLISIESELKRRQAIFADASKKIGVSNIDIYKYQKLFRDGTVSEPLQHLFIISDEFAELKTQQPEFMAQLVSAARIGRSLGVHLILATQKPSGVVDDQIWSNSKFRVCLKVQERSDSMDMLKRPDAAELSQTGRFYLQVGYNELFELGQSAWAGASYIPADKVVVEKISSVAVIDRTGRVIKQVKVGKKRNLLDSHQKQLDAITDYLCKIAKEEKIVVRKLWLDPIPDIIFLAALKEKYRMAVLPRPYEINPTIGEYDDPANQRQCPLCLPISKEGNAVIYGAAGSGKAEFLTTLVYSIMVDHSPEEVNIYILDFGAETLRSFSKSPHVGDVILSYETEKVSNLFRMLKSEMDKRKKLFANFGGNYSSYMFCGEDKIPSILIMINNFSAFTELFEDKEEAVSYLSREGTKYGIYFILTAVGTGTVRFRLLQNFKQLLVLQLNDESEYSTVVGKTEGLVPSPSPGRGLIRREAIYEFQTAKITDQKEQYSFVRNFCAEYAETWGRTGAKKIPVLPDTVDLDFISDYVRIGSSLSLPIGVEKTSLEVHFYPFASSYIQLVLSSGNDHICFLHTLTKLIATIRSIEVTMFDVPESFRAEENPSIRYYVQIKDIEKAIDQLYDLVLYRNNFYKEQLEKGESTPVFDPVVIAFNSITALKNVLSDLSNKKLGLILEKGEAKYSILIILGESVKNLTTLSFEKWYKKHISQKDGIWIGGGITEQYQIKTNKVAAEMHEDITAEFGYAIEKGIATKIKVLNVKGEGI